MHVLTQIDPDNLVVTPIANVTAGIEGLWGGGAVYIPSTQSIYAVPSTAGTVLRINTSTDIVSELDEFSNGTMWVYAVHSPATGAIYGIPSHAESVLKIDTTNGDKVSMIGSLGSAAHKWQVGVLAPSNGHIYMTPHAGETVGKINTLTDQVTQFTDETLASGSRGRWFYSVAAANGMIYSIGDRCCGEEATILKINPYLDTAFAFGSSGLGSLLYRGLVATPASVGGALYGIPGKGPQVLKINPSDDSTSLFGSFGTTSSHKWGHGIYSPHTRCIYGTLSQRSSQVCVWLPRLSSLRCRFSLYLPASFCFPSSY